MRNYFLFSFVWTLLLLLRYGYQIGLGDGAEFLPFTLYAKNPELFSADLFVQSMLSMGWNERSLFGYFFSIFSDHEWAAFVFHLVLAYFMSLGIQISANRFLENFWWSQAATGLVLIVFLSIDLGGNYMFYNNVQGASFAKTIAVWALVAWLYDRKALGTLLLIPATWFQPLVGFQLFLAYAAAYVVHLWMTRDKNELKFCIASIIVYLVLAGWFVFFIFIGHKGQGPSVDTKKFMDMSYRLILYCHYMPHYFSKKGFLLHLLLFVVAIIFFKSRNRPVFYFLLALGAGYIIYLIGYYVLDEYLIVSSWWFRTTMWVKLPGIIAVTSLAAIWLKRKSMVAFKVVPIVILLLVVMSTIIYRADFYMFPWVNYASLNDELDMAYQCKNRTDQNALFIQPYEFTALKYHGQRSSYVEADRVLRKRQDISTWYSRVGAVHGLYRVEQIARNPAVFSEMAVWYKKLKEEDLEKLKEQGVDYMITYSDVSYPNTVLLYKNKTYQLLKL